MKKIILSSIVIIAFIAYSAYQRTLDKQTPVVAPKEISSKPPSPTAGLTQTSSIAPAESTPTPTPKPNPSSPYKDGVYTGNAADAFYGFIQVKTTIAGGKITDIQFLQYPNDHHRSIEINNQADPILASEAIQAQNANVDAVSGATDSSEAFVKSLQSALDQAKN